MEKRENHLPIYEEEKRLPFSAQRSSGVPGGRLQMAGPAQFITAVGGDDLTEDEIEDISDESEREEDSGVGLG